MRLFFSIPVPQAAWEAWGLWQDAMKARGIAGAWVRPENMQLTLAFLGEVDTHWLEDLMHLTTFVAKRNPAFALESQGLGGFPKEARARVLWLRFHPCDALEHLAADLRHELSRVPWPFDRKPFTAHVTLARLQPPCDVSRLEPPPATRFEVQEMRLCQSVATPAGSRYMVQAKGGLGAMP